MYCVCDVLSDWFRKLLEEYDCVDVHARASFGGGRGDASPHFSGWGDSIGIVPHFSVQKNCEAYSLTHHSPLSLLIAAT